MSKLKSTQNKEKTNTVITIVDKKRKASVSPDKVIL